MGQAGGEHIPARLPSNPSPFGSGSLPKGTLAGGGERSGICSQGTGFSV